MTGGPLAGLAFAGRWRRYQELALEAFEADRRAGRTRTHIVAPPGSGKTLVGLEMVRRLGRAAVVFAPNTAVQGQWPRAAQLFGADEDLVGMEPGRPITALTYQAICRLDDPAQVLGDVAAERWAAERAAATGQSAAEADAEGRAWQGGAAERRRRELRAIDATLRREIARAEHGELHLGDLLHRGARRRIADLRAAGVGVVVLDECHHLASLWGYAIRVVVEELGADVHVIGLTATPPGTLTRDEAALYEALLGPVDFTVPTPAVVRDGHLAPYHELAWITQPLPAEDRWLSEHDGRFRELITALHADPEGPLSFPAWVIERMRGRRTESGRDPDGHEPTDSWAAFSRRRPRLARAGIRFLAAAGLALPAGAPGGESHRRQPTTEDWLVLLEDYALRRLRPDPGPEAAARHEAVAVALRDLGYTLTRRGLRRGASDVDRLLATSAARPLALVDVIAAELAGRGPDLRAVVLCDVERRRRRADDALVEVLDRAAGTAAEALAAVAHDGRTAHLHPLLVSGRGLRCAPADAPHLLEQMGRRAGVAAGDRWRSTPDGDGLVELRLRTDGWNARTWVPLATAALGEGDTGLLVGTRALLGEGWDAPRVNCLVDMTTATTRVSVTQMRGRSLRLDPADPTKLASNWDIVCIAPGHARGEADYDRFVRKHGHLLAPAEDGTIEAGPSHVHPALGPFAPPPVEEFADINRQMVARCAERERARDLWAIGTPYHAIERSSLVVRRGRTSPAAPPPIDAGAIGAMPIPAGRMAAAWALGGVRGELNELMPLERAALVVRDALAACGELSIRAGEALTLEPRANGYLRVELPEADAAESDRFARALDQLLIPNPAARYVIGRHVPGGQSRLGALARALVGRPPHPVRWASVPDHFGNRRARAEHFATAWRRWFGPGELRFTQREVAGRQALAEAAASADPHIEVATRTTWT